MVRMDDFNVGTPFEIFEPSQQFPWQKGLGTASGTDDTGTPERYLQAHRGAIRDEGQLEKGRALLR